MKVSVAAIVATAATASAFPFCALTCFTSLMGHDAAKTCTEDNMFLCFCKIPALTLAYRDCACSTCGSQSAAAIATGKDICNSYGAPVTWLPDTCP